MLAASHGAAMAAMTPLMWLPVGLAAWALTTMGAIAAVLEWEARHNDRGEQDSNFQIGN